MLQKNTVLLDLKDYNRLKSLEDNYYSLKNSLDNCLTKVDKTGNQVEAGFYMNNPIVKVKINLRKLQKLLDIQDYEIEIIN